MNWLRKNLGLKIASIFISMVLWLYVESQTLQNTSHTQMFTLNYDSLDTSNFVIISKKPTTIAVQAEGSPTALHDLERTNPERFEANVQLDNAHAGVDRYRIAVQRDSVRDLGVKYLAPEPITLNIAAIIHSQPKHVKVDPVNTPDGFYPASLDVAPETVILSGPGNDVARVTQVRARVNLKDYKPGSIYNPVPEPLDSSGRPVPSVHTDVSTVKVVPSLSISQDSKNVPVSLNWVGVPPFGYSVSNVSVEPAQVALRGDPDLLKKIDTVQTESIELNRLTSNTTKRVQLRALPPGVKVMNIHTVRVRIAITPPAKPPQTTVPPTIPTQVTPPSTSGH